MLPPLNPNRNRPRPRVPLTKVENEPTRQAKQHTARIQKNHIQKLSMQDIHIEQMTQLHSIRVAIQSIPETISKLFVVAYKSLFPEVLITKICARNTKAGDSLVSKALSNIQNVSKMSQQHGRALTRIVCTFDNLPVGFSQPNLPSVLHDEIRFNLQLLQNSMNNKADLLTSLHLSLINIYRSAYRVAKLAIDEQVNHLIAENKNIQNIVNAQSQQKNKTQLASRKKLEEYRQRIEELFRLIMSKYHIATKHESILLNPKIPVHSRIQQLLNACELTVHPDVKRLETVAKSIPVDSLKIMIERLKNLNIKRQLAYQNKATHQIQTLNQQIQSLRHNLKKEIIRNKSQQKKAYTASFSILKKNKVTDHDNQSPKKAFEDLSQMSFLFELLDNEHKTSDQQNQIHKEIVVEEMQRKGCSAFGEWFVSTFWYQINALVHKEARTCNQTFFTQMQKLSTQCQHLILELKQAKFFTVSKEIDTCLYNMTKNMEYRLLTNQKAVFADLIDFCSEITITVRQ